MRSSRLLIVALLLTTACGQAKGTHAVAPPARTHAGTQVALSGFAARTARTGTARIAMWIRMSGMPGGGTIVANATGVLAFRVPAADMRLRTAAPGGGAVIAMRPTGPGSRSTWPGSSGRRAST